MTLAAIGARPIYSSEGLNDADATREKNTWNQLLKDISSQLKSVTETTSNYSSPIEYLGNYKWTLTRVSDYPEHFERLSKVLADYGWDSETILDPTTQQPCMMSFWLPEPAPSGEVPATNLLPSARSYSEKAHDLAETHYDSYVAQFERGFGTLKRECPDSCQTHTFRARWNFIRDLHRKGFTAQIKETPRKGHIIEVSRNHARPLEIDNPAFFPISEEELYQHKFFSISLDIETIAYRILGKVLESTESTVTFIDPKKGLEGSGGIGARRILEARGFTLKERDISVDGAPEGHKEYTISLPPPLAAPEAATAQ